MKKIFCFVALLVVGCLFGCSAGYAKKKEIAERRKVVDAWIAAGDKVAGKSQDPAVAKIMEFLKGTSTMVIPRRCEDLASGKILFELAEEVRDTNYKIMIMSLSKKDAELGEKWKKVLESNNYAFLFIPDESNN